MNAARLSHTKKHHFNESAFSFLMIKVWLLYINQSKAA